MSGTGSDNSTDLAWEAWGARDPYFGVITEPRFRREHMTEEARREFFRSGEIHVQFVLDYARHFIDASFAPGAVLDFGCGVGRTLIPFAAVAAQATGLDVSPSMLQEARLNCAEHGRSNVQLLLSDDALSALSGHFDLIHSCIVLQHIPVARGRAIFVRLLEHLRPGGIGALQVTYGSSRFTDTFGIPPSSPVPSPASVQPPPPTAVGGAAPEQAPPPDPEMQMNAYNVGELLFCLQQIGVQRLHVELTDHAGELGVFLFFRKPPVSAAV